MLFCVVANHKYLFNPDWNHIRGDLVQSLCVTYEPHLSETFNLKQAEGWRYLEQSWQGKRWSEDLTSPKPGIKRAAGLRSADTSSQTHIKVSESRVQRMSCLSSQPPRPHRFPPPPPPFPLDQQSAVLKAACLAALLLLWPTLQATSVSSDSTPSALYMETQRLRLSPLSASDPEADCAAGPVPRPLTLHLSELYFSRAEPDSPCSRRACLHCWGFDAVFWVRSHRAESEPVQQTWLHKPDVTGLSRTFRGSSVFQLASVYKLQPTGPHTADCSPLASGLREPPQGGGLCVCVCLSLSLLTWASVCLCVFVGGSRALGTESGSLLTATVAATLATQEEKMCWMSEWERHLQ